MDTVNEKKRSAIMAKIKSKDTKPELIVRRYLYSRGYRYRKNYKLLPGTPDIVMKKYKVVIFIHGCFWHGHNIDGHIPHSNQEYWKKKIERNKIRDNENKALLLKKGWNVIIIWECQLKTAVREKTLKELEYYINKSFLDQYRINRKDKYTIEDNYSCVAEQKEEYKKG